MFEKTENGTVAELARTIAGPQEVPRTLANQAMTLKEIEYPSDQDDAAVIDEVVGEARRVMEYPEPPRHWPW